MENATKALIMAAGVLIGVLLASLAVYLFVDFGSSAAEINARRTEQQIAEFNARFTAYEAYDTSGNKKKWTIYDVITVVGYAQENNKYYNDNFEEYGITVQLNSETILNNTNKKELKEDEKQRMITDVLNNADQRVYTCTIEYHDNGRVSQIRFNGHY